MPKPPLPEGEAKDKIVQTRIDYDTYNNFLNYCTNQSLSPSKILREFVEQCAENDKKFYGNKKSNRYTY